MPVQSIGQNISGNYRPAIARNVGLGEALTSIYQELITRLEDKINNSGLAGVNQSTIDELFTYQENLKKRIIKLSKYTLAKHNALVKLVHQECVVIDNIDSFKQTMDNAELNTSKYKSIIKEMNTLVALREELDGDIQVDLADAAAEFQKYMNEYKTKVSQLPTEKARVLFSSCIETIQKFLTTLINAEKTSEENEAKETTAFNKCQTLISEIRANILRTQNAKKENASSSASLAPPSPTKLESSSSSSSNSDCESNNSSNNVSPFTTPVYASATPNRSVLHQPAPMTLAEAALDKTNQLGKNVAAGVPVVAGPTSGACCSLM